MASESTITCDTFHEQLVRRDALCVRTGMPVELGAGLHIIPNKQGDEVHSIILKEDVSDVWLFQWIRSITLHHPDS